MKKQVIHNVAFDVVMFSALYFGVIEGVTAASNVVLFVVWFASLTAMMLAFTWPRVVREMPTWKADARRKLCRSRVWRVYDVSTDVALAVALAAAGWFVTAAVFAIGYCALKGEMYKWARQEGASA